MTMYEFDGRRPKTGSGCWIHETAQLIGDVVVGDECFIGAGAVLRGDFGSIRVGSRSSIQESCTMHSRPNEGSSVGDDCAVGHGAVLHGCRVGDRCVVGMNSTISDGAVIGDDCIVREASFIKSGVSVPENSLIGGNPAQIKGELKDHQAAMKDAGVEMYRELTGRYVESAKKINDIRQD